MTGLPEGAVRMTQTRGTQKEKGAREQMTWVKCNHFRLKTKVKRMRAEEMRKLKGLCLNSRSTQVWARS